MLRKFLTLCCSVVAVMSAVSIIGSYDDKQNNISKERSITTNDDSIISAPQSSVETLPSMQSSQDDKIETGYVLMQYENGIAVYKSGENTLYQMIEFNVESLPQEDKRMLIGGIYVSDDKELQALIEDYTG